MPRPRRRNPWSSTAEVLLWVLFAALLFPAALTGWAVGHYTSIGKSSATVVHTVTDGGTTGTTPAATTTTTATTTPSGGSGGNATAGKAVFAANNCASCHTFKPAGATGTIGPDLDSAPAADAKADHNMALAAFVKESIINPDAYIAKGFNKGLMPTDFGSKLSSTELTDLVAFIVSGSKS